ncbi:DUF2949 domain-containing protein [Candidatus Cyanaurora vandensis]|uniref:DUF2949 domain-containing protein n=1 Tax=Candidatus Cyanaurora vandensis TaxID=2714958 RepID=UPI00258064B3|nr:DUF2949 domain-containing protein [Candidatus Cyanaurora vandensis]
MTTSLNTTRLLALVTQAQLHVAEKVQHREQGPIEIILWRLGFITTHQLATIL